MVSDLAARSQARGEGEDNLIALAEEMPFCDQDPDHTFPLGALTREGALLKLLDQAKMDEAPRIGQAVHVFGGDRVIDQAMGNFLTAEFLFNFGQRVGKMG